MAKTRSPNYPQLDFSEALEKARLVYKSAHQHSISDDEIAAALNYMSLNGRSMGVISAIKKYGLLVPAGDGFKISEDAFNVFELPPESKEHIESLKKMAFTPQIFVELRETYGEQLPSDQILRHYLIKNKFNPNVADEVVKNFRATIELVTQAEESYNQSMKPTAIQPLSDLIPRHQQYSRQAVEAYNKNPVYIMDDETDSTDEITKELKLVLSNENEVRLLFKGNPSKIDITKLIKLLEISFDLYIQPQAEPIQRSLPLVDAKPRNFDFEKGTEDSEKNTDL